MELVCASYTAGFDIEVIADHFEVTPRKVRSILREWCPRFVQSEEASDQALLELSGHAPPIGSRERIGTFTLRSILIDRVGEAPSFYASTIRHLCGLAWCTEHLAWGTAKDNAMDRKFHETYGYGQLAPESYRETA
jgi:hypothetical protein